METFSNVILYDWVPFFQELCTSIASLAQNEQTRNEKLKEKALAVFGPDHALTKYSMIDPFSFIYSLAQKNTSNQKNEIFGKVKAAFEISNSLPTDWIFPSPPPNTKSLFFNHGSYTTNDNEEINSSVLWEAFNSVSGNIEISANAFQTILRLKNVGVAKLTQTLFLINSSLYTPIDSHSLWFPFIEKDAIKNIESNGLPTYQEIRHSISSVFPNCQFYEG